MGGSVMGSEAPTSEIFALFSDSHIAADHELIVRGAQMATNLEKCVASALAVTPKVGSVILSGDCAYLNGQHEDYETFAKVTKPIRDAGLPLHLMMGNHDDRAPFTAVLGRDPAMPPPVETRIAGVVKTHLANWFLLDSLDATNHTPGLLGEAQRKWLAGALEAHAEKPAIVVVHHNIVTTPEKTSLQDSAELLDLLRPQKQVKACLFGHTHVWESKADESGIHLINLPPTAYVFKQGRPNGWVQATLTASALKLQLHALDSAHPQNGEVKDFAWRA